METNKLANFIYLITDTPEEDLDQLKAELRDAGIEPDDIPEIISETIQRSKVKYKLQRGKALRERVEKILQVGLPEIKNGEYKNNLALAFRNLKELDEKDINEILRDDKLLEELAGKKGAG